jgi:peptidyl-prolyl cis-trans isomerase D
MVIRKINSVFARHGRIIFGVITVIIIISFMGFMQPGSGFGSLFSGWGKKNVYGEVFGENISRNDIIEKANRDLIVNDLIYNIGLNSYSATNKVQASAFSNLCLLAAAKRRGIIVSNKEIADFIFERTKFINPKTKAFDKKLYSNYIDGDLKSNGFSASDLDLAVREYMINSKLLDELQNSVVVTDGEISEFYKLLNEKYYVSYGVFDKASYLKKTKISLKEAQNYFKNYTPAMEDYMPGKSKALLVEFKYNDAKIKKLVAKELTPEAVMEFYNKNKNLFMSPKGGKKPKAIPFAKAKAKAKKMLASRYAKKFASEKALKFAEAAYDVVGETIEKKQPKAFAEILAKFEYKAIKTDWFRDDAKKVAGISEQALIREISALREVPVSNSVVGKNAAYVAFVTNRIMPRPALFEEIKNKLIGKLKNQKALKMARSQARELVAKLQKMNSAARLKTISGSKNPKFKLVKPFSLMASPRTQYGNVIAGQARELKNGEVAPAQKILNGSIVIVLRKRILPAMSRFDKKQKTMLVNIYKRQKVSVAQGAFSAWLQTKCKQNRK